MASKVKFSRNHEPALVASALTTSLNSMEILATMMLGQINTHSLATYAYIKSKAIVGQFSCVRMYFLHTHVHMYVYICNLNSYFCFSVLILEFILTK